MFGFYLPYDPDTPKTGFLQRSTDGTKTWGKPEVLLDPKKYTAWPRRIRVLRDGRVLVLLGVAPLAAGTHTRDELSKQLQPMLVVSSDQGKTWKGPIAAVPKDQPDGWTEEFDVAELANGDLLAVFRRASDAKRWQGVLKKSDDTWAAGKVGPSVLPHSGQPELLATQGGTGPAPRHQRHPLDDGRRQDLERPESAGDGVLPAERADGGRPDLRVRPRRRRRCVRRGRSVHRHGLVSVEETLKPVGRAKPLAPRTGRR